MTRLTQSVALACGTAGAFVDVSSYADLGAVTSRSWGRQSEFEDTAPGTFSFTLDNADGRFNPGSTILATPVTEGMQVCWQLGSRLTAGTILAIEPAFPSGESAWAQVRVTCDDMLGNAARHQMSGSIRQSLYDTSGLIYLWPFSDVAGSVDAMPTVGSPPPFMLTKGLGGSLTFGVQSATSKLYESSAAALTTGGVFANEVVAGGWMGGPFPRVAYPRDTVGSWGFWYSGQAGLDLSLVVYLTAWPGVAAVTLYLSTTINMQAGTSTPLTGPAVTTGTPYYISVGSSVSFSGGVGSLVFTLYVNGVSYGSRTFTGASFSSLTDADKTPIRVVLIQSVASVYTSYVALVSHSMSPISDYYAPQSKTEATTLSLISATAPEITLDTLPASLASAPLADPDFSASTLDALNDVIRAEQGSLYSVTSGTLTAPVEKVTVRARDRVAAVTYSFNVETEADGATDFIRDITNMVQTMTAEGPTNVAAYTDTTLTDRVGSKNATATLPLRDYTDLYTWATDRVARGANVNLRPAAITIDAFTTPTDRTADLLALVPGDRVQLTGLPTALGFTTWDGWLLGVEESHTVSEHKFTLYLQPVLPRPIILDTDRLTAGGNLTLTSNITNSATSISVTSSDGSLLSTTGGDYPQTYRLESEVITVSAVSGASSPQTVTCTRGSTDPVTGLATTAAAHLAGVTLELADYTVLAF